MYTNSEIKFKKGIWQLNSDLRNKPSSKLKILILILGFFKLKKF
jgi:hypothetical protein